MDQQQLNLKIMECVSNAIKCRLLIEVLKSGKATAKYLAEKCEDIPQTTLYRNLKRMTEDGVLKVVNETQIRGTVEKTYAVTFDLNDTNTIIGENAGKMYMQMFLQYILTFAKQFKTYCDTPGIDIEKDRSGFSLSHLYLTDEELETALSAVSKILSPLQNNKPVPGRKLRTVGVIVSPEQQNGEHRSGQPLR